jgi:hypothetical protein
MRFYIRFLFLLWIIFNGIPCFGIQYPVLGQKKMEKQLSDSLTLIANSYVSAIGRVGVISISYNAIPNTILITANDKLATLSFRPENVARIYTALNNVFSTKSDSISIVCQIGNKSIEDFIPNFYRTNFKDQHKQFKITSNAAPLVRCSSRPYDLLNGLQNRHIALWQSHGLFFDQKTNKWKWQRPRVMQVVEDLYTQSFVLPYLVPMLEHAGANVLLPRERDTQLHEVVVDNDTKDADSRYREHNDQNRWKEGDSVGFANPKLSYRKFENPFRLGTYRTTTTISNAQEASSVEWSPQIPDAGFYAVYVSYKSLPNSTRDAHYTVFHKGGKTDFLVNQTIGGGTWLYLGSFQFEKGQSNQGKVVLSNLSSESGKIVTADGVKFGGGKGNIARNRFQPEAIPLFTQFVDSLHLSTDSICALPVFEPEVSGYPRFTEGARYWLQWAGVPDSIYSKSHGRNDYTDDFQSRGNWVNYLNGSSVNAPLEKGLGIPIDLAFAFHTDAGTTNNDSIIGTLGICTISNSQGETLFKNGISRWASRDLTDIIQTQIVSDVRRLYAPAWSTRGMWNKSYSESRVPQVPTMLLELLSHQNFADMRYGLDPRFRFTVSRSIYKGMLKYLAAANDFEYVVQPLPVKHFGCKFINKNSLQLSWDAVIDSLEPSSTPTQYIVYKRIDGGDFDNGELVTSNQMKVAVESGKIYSFKVAAVNKGGESFPSEILSAYRAVKERGEVLIINGFTRLSAPASIDVAKSYAGFLNDEDAGVPYLNEISFVGKQSEFDRSKPYLNDDNPGFGASYANYEGKVIAGNSFDYPLLHGRAMKAVNYSFVSCGSDALLAGYVELNNYKVVDLILGKQKQTYIGNGKKSPEFKTFPLALQHSITDYCNRGGNLLVSGAYMGSDLCHPKLKLPEDTVFLNQVLKCKFITEKACVGGEVKVVSSPFKAFEKINFNYFAQPNAVSYFVESPNSIEPMGEGAHTFCRYAENNMSAAVAYSGKYRVCALGFPFEVIENEKDRADLMKEVLSFFTLGEKVAAKHW